MRIQFLNWEATDRKVASGASTQGQRGGQNGFTKYDYKYVIYGFGRREVEGKLDPSSICVIFNNFYPYFYFLAEDETKSIKEIMQTVTDKFNILKNEFKWKDRRHVAQKCLQYQIKFFQESFLSEVIFEKTTEHYSQIFMGKGFENFKKRRFIRVYFKTLRAFRFFQSFIKYCDADYTIYEGNINPMLKMFHDQNFSPSSWLEFSENMMIKKSDVSKWSKADIEYAVYYNFFGKFITVVNENNSLWFKLCSFDIECDSSHGDYPVAKKGYTKFIREMKTLLKKIKKKDVEENPSFLKGLVEEMNMCIKSNTEHFSQIFLKSLSSPGLDLYIPSITLDEMSVWLKKIMLDSEKAPERSGEKPPTMPQGGTTANVLPVTSVWTDFEAFLLSKWGEVEGDAIIQIGNIIEYPKGCYKKVIFCLNETAIEDDTEGETIVVSCETESKLLLEWSNWLQREDPDLLMGYNIFNFDNEYIHTRAQECNVLDTLLSNLSRLDDEKAIMKDMTKGTGKYFWMNGREMIDLMDYVKKNYSLESYSLDNVSARFIRGKITKVVEDIIHIQNNSIGLKVNDFFKVFINNGIFEDKFIYKDKSKFKIKAIEEKKLVLYEKIELESDFIMEWCLSKDDILPRQIFEFQKGTKFQRGQIAKYCIQDCMLCHYIFQKLEVLINNMAMSNVCFVPFAFLFLRGQSVKIFSLIAKQCADENYRIPVLEQNDEEQESQNEESYEGALVLDPMVGIYINNPVSVNDFNSLYPSCGIADNISPDTHVLHPEYMNLPGLSYNTIEFDELEYQKVFGKSGKLKKNKEAVKVGKRTCVFVVFPNEEKGILPKIWSKLLSERKATRKKMELETDAFRKTLLDGLQLAFKTTANSMYGIFGFRKSPLYYQDVAASITACGRKNLMLAKEFIETNYVGSKIIYGDTDSLFVSFPSTKPNATELEKIYESIDTATEAGDRVSSLLKKPHNLGFEKCISPFILMARKRYTGLYYTSKSPKKYMNTMGFALKRRDNALIVKEIVGNAIKMILYEKNIEGSIKYVQESIFEMLKGNYPIEKFVVTKTLRNNYACPEQIGHYMLSLKMGERDPGNKPKVGDRIPYVFIKTLKENVNQSERIESPKYITENHCPIDYMYYLTNQLMNPLTQVYQLVFHEKTQEIVFSELLQYAFQKQHKMSSIRAFFSETNSNRFFDYTQQNLSAGDSENRAIVKGPQSQSQKTLESDPQTVGDRNVELEPEASPKRKRSKIAQLIEQNTRLSQADNMAKKKKKSAATVQSAKITNYFSKK
jgi:DNA polymerase elongation subunit (family B)